MSKVRMYTLAFTLVCAAQVACFLWRYSYARLDGFITEEGDILLNDPNTTSGMMPSSFFFHQAAEVGLNPSQFLTFILYTSLQERASLISRHGTHQGAI